MAFKTECTRFLDTITNLRQQTIDKEVQKALETKHLPYRNQLQTATEQAVAEVVAEAERQILEIQERRDKQITAFRNETILAIESDKQRIIADAKAKVSKDYDAFILGVSGLVDNTNIND